MKKKTFNQFLFMKSTDYLDGYQIYLLDLQNTDILDQKLSSEKIKSWGESRYFDFHKSLRKASSSTRKRRGLLYNFFHNWFLLLKNDQEI